jgi:TIR domain-containing protein
MATARVFISYSRDDERWKERLLSHLRVFERSNALEVWNLSDLEAGSNWDEEIMEAIRQTDVAVLLISPSFLASDFIVRKEIPALFKRRNTVGIPIIPILVQNSFWTSVRWLTELQFANDPARPLSVLSEEEQERAYAAIASRIAELAQAVAERAAQGEHTSFRVGSEQLV